MGNFPVVLLTLNSNQSNGYFHDKQSTSLAYALQFDRVNQKGIRIAILLAIHLKRHLHATPFLHRADQLNAQLALSIRTKDDQNNGE